MAQATPLIVIGAAGRMGRMVLECAGTSEEPFGLVAAIEVAKHPLLGKDLRSIVPSVLEEITITDEAPWMMPPGSVAIVFTSPEGAIFHIGWSQGTGCPTVIGTTGFTAEQKEKIKEASKDVPLLVAPNMSVGVNILFELVDRAVAMTGDNFDVEIMEMHHRFKKDAPSGTAERLAEIVLKRRGGDEATCLRHGRKGMEGERTAEEVGMHSLRGGDVVGDHTVILAGMGERIEITHRAQSRETFARGALRAARWLSGRDPGLYSMKDVLGMGD